MLEILLIIMGEGADYRFAGGPLTIEFWGGGGGRADPLSAGNPVTV